MMNIHRVHQKKAGDVQIACHNLAREGFQDIKAKIADSLFASSMRFISAGHVSIIQMSMSNFNKLYYFSLFSDESLFT